MTTNRLIKANFLFLILISFSTVVFSKDLTVQDYVGKTIDFTNLPPNFRYDGGESISITGDGYEGFALETMSVSNKTFLLLTHHHKVLDVMPGGPSMCLKDDVKKIDIEIIATTHFLRKEGYRPAIKAWRANRKTQKFEPISPKGILCWEEGRVD